MRTMIVLLATLITIPATAAEKRTEHTVRLSEGEEPQKASVTDMAWLAGHWTGEGLGGRTTETWSEPDSGVMLGTFRLIRDEKTVFYEFLILTVTERGLTMRLKHFHPDLTGWEEKDKFVEFRYVGRNEKLFQFEGLTFRRDSDDALTIFLALRGKEGTIREETFKMTRK